MGEDRGSDRGEEDRRAGGEDRRAGEADRDEDVDAGTIDRATAGGFDEVPEESDYDDVQDEAAERQHERTERVEEVLAGVREDLGDHTYPVNSEEVAATYADQPIDLPNETEWVESALRRIDERFEDEEAAYGALVTVFEQGEHLDERSGARGPQPPYWDEERAETQHEFDENALEDAPDPNEGDPSESSVVRSQRRAREAQADSDEGE